MARAGGNGMAGTGVFLDALSTLSLNGNASAHAPCHTLCVLREGRVDND